MQHSMSEQATCFHGGASYSWIGETFENLAHIKDLIDADVLDAWFNPSPRAVQVLHENLSWTLRCSPPAVPRGVERTLAHCLDIDTDNLICGAGSSSLIFLALRELLNPDSRVLILDPTYGEYAHVLSNVIGCRCDSFALDSKMSYIVDLQQLRATVCANNYDLVIIVNPNNPSGQLLPREQLESTIDSFPKRTKVWIDEAYIDYAGINQSLISFAASRSNVIVCKSLSKVLALSGLRVAYLVSHFDFVHSLRRITPPWSMSLPAQLVLIEALNDRPYYENCYALTHQLRNELALKLGQCGLTVYSSTANFLLVDYPVHLPKADEFIRLCREETNLLLRNVRSMGKAPSDHCFRIAVKDAATNGCMVAKIRDVIKSV